MQYKNTNISCVVITFTVAVVHTICGGPGDVIINLIIGFDVGLIVGIFVENFIYITPSFLVTETQTKFRFD